MRTFLIISILGLLSIFESNFLYAQTTQITKIAQSIQSNKPLHTEAVLFARDNYESFTNLSGANNDAHLLITGFLKKSGTKNNQISLLCDRPDKFNDIKDDISESDTAKNELKIQDPTRENLINELKRVAEISCNRLVVAISSHGASAYGKSYIISQGGAEEENIFSKVSPNDIVSEIKKQNLISLEEIRDILQNAKASQILLLWDVSRSSSISIDSEDSSHSTASGSEAQSFMREFNDLVKSNQPVTQSASDSIDQQQSSKAPNFAIITSCSLGQNAKEDPTGNGLFTRAFVEGLEGNADRLGCLDGRISLTEAYNYAFSKISKHQTPEIFVDSNFQNFDLLEYEITEPSVDDDDVTFLLKSASIFLDNRNTKSEEVEAGVAALDCVLENVPNNKLAYSLRGNGNRMLKNYEQSIEDFSTVGQKLQLYAKQTDPNSPLSLQVGNENNRSSITIKDKDLLTISKVDKDWLLVTEINNVPLENHGYIHQSNVTWNPKDARDRIVETEMQEARTVRPSSRPYSDGGMISPRRNPQGVIPGMSPIL